MVFANPNYLYLLLLLLPMIGWYIYKLSKSQASLIYCRVKGEEFVLHFNPNKGEYERISLRRPSMRRRCNEVFANENFIVKNPKSYGDFMAPRTLGEFLYDVKERIAGWCDRLYIKARYNGKWMW